MSCGAAVPCLAVRSACTTDAAGKVRGAMELQELLENCLGRQGSRPSKFVSTARVALLPGASSVAVIAACPGPRSLRACPILSLGRRAVPVTAVGFSFPATDRFASGPRAGQNQGTVQATALMACGSSRAESTRTLSRAGSPSTLAVP